MNRSLLGRAAITSLALGIATVACTPNGSHPAALGQSTTKAAEVASKQAAKARAALAQNKGASAVSSAENAVALVPNDASYRMLLGQTYLAAGRFASAETSFKDTLSLKADQPKALFDLALAQIAQGRGQEAQKSLQGLGGAIPASDLGLAMTLAGDRQGGIQMLIDAVRGPSSNARVRQNLALALGLDGRWPEARAMAMQDTPPQRLQDQLSGWAALAQPNAGPQQIAAMLGVTPVADAGLPQRLALVTPAPTAAPVALAAADSVPAPAPVALPKIAPAPETLPAPAAPVRVATADLAPVPPASVTVPLAAPEPVAPVSAPIRVAQNKPNSITVPLIEEKPAMPEMLAKPVAKPTTPVMLVAVHKPVDKTPALLRTPAQPEQARFRPAVAIVPVSSHGSFAVQLGAFKRAGAVNDAWSRLAKMAPTLAAYSPSRGQFSMSGSTFARLSITGFSTHADAARVCGIIKAKGGHCFVRAVAGDAPLEWVRRDTGTQVAMR